MPLPLVTVGALIFDPEGRILIVHTHKWRGMWGVPGGKIEEGETMEAALVRELREETGLAITEPRLVYVQDAIHSPEFYKPAHMILLNFTCRSRGGAVTLDDEADAFEWVTPREALSRPLNTPTRHLIERVLAETPDGPH